MPALEYADHNQKATLWRASGTLGADEYGKPRVDLANPEDVDCRWEHTRRQTVDAKGQTIALDAMVYTEEDIELGSRLYLIPVILDEETGEEYFQTTGSVGDDSDLMEVVTVGQIPDLKNRFIEREYGLQRWQKSPAPG